MNPLPRFPCSHLVCAITTWTVAFAPAQDSFEPDDDWPQAKAIWTGSPQPRSIDPVGDQDYATFTLPTTCSVFIETSGSGGDTVMWLYDANRNQIEFNDDIDPAINRYSRIDRLCGTDPLPAGTYYVRVREFNSDETLLSYGLQVIISSCTSRDIHVDDDAPGDPGPGDPAVSDPLEDGTPEHPFDAIQEAIDFAIDNDRVIVAPGIYSGTGNTDLDPSHMLGWGTRLVDLVSSAGPDTTIIDCQGADRGIHLHNGEIPGVIIRGFTITGAAVAGIECYDASATIEDCILTGNRQQAIHLAYADWSTVSRCRIENNTGNHLSPGIYCLSSAATITDCVIANNHGGTYGAGVVFEDTHTGDPQLVRCRVTGNTSTINGGGITCIWSAPVIENCVIAGNFSASHGGGIHLETTSHPTITHCNIIGNESGDGGGGIYAMWDSSPMIANTILWQNHPAEIGLAQTQPGIPELNHCVIPGGWAGAGANNIDADPALLLLHERIESPVKFWALAPGSPCIDAGMSAGTPANDMHGRPRYDDPATPDHGSGPVPFTDIGAHEFKAWFVNAAAGDDGNDGLLHNPAPGGGGPKQRIQAAIEAAATGDQLVVAPGDYAGPGNRDLDFLGKNLILRSESGPSRTIIDCQGFPADPHRGAVFQHGEGPAAVLSGFSIVHGDVSPSDPGGGVLVTDGSPTILNCRIANCSAANGGAISLIHSAASVTDCLLEGNHAVATAPGTGDGGAIQISSGEPAIVNCLVTGNTADASGGGIHSIDGRPRVLHCTIAHNTAALPGGGIFDQSNATATDCIVWHNSPDSILHLLGNTFVTHSNVEGGTGEAWFGTGSIDVPPRFTSGPRHNYYLCHADLQGVHSPCVDSGSAPAAELGFGYLTTRTDSGLDIATLDMGYHAPHYLQILGLFFAGDDVIIEWNGHAGGSYTVQWSADLVGWHPVFVGGVNSWTDIGGRLRPAAFYRVIGE